MWIRILCLASASFFVIHSLPLIAAPPVSINSTTTVTVEGYGTDVQSAIDNATQNALLNVAGAYISSDTTLETRTKITDGIRTYSKSFKDRTSQTSNGVIQDVVIQNVTKLGNQFKAVAQVTVRTGELRTYVLELSEGENTVPEGLFSSVKENVKNQERGMLTFEQIFLPILDGTAIEFEISKPKSVINTDKSIFLYGTRSSLEKITDPRVVHIRIIESIKSDYFKKITDYLNYSSVKSDNMTVNNQRYPYYYYREIREETGNLIIVLADGPTGVIIDSDDGVEVKLNEKKIYALPIKYAADSFQNDFSNYCNEKIRMGNYSLQFKMPIFKLTFSGPSGYQSERIIKQIPEEGESGSPRFYNKKFSVYNGNEEPYYCNSNFCVKPLIDDEAGYVWDNVHCDSGRVPHIVKKRILDVFVKMTDVELEKSTSVSVSVSN